MDTGSNNEGDVKLNLWDWLLSKPTWMLLVGLWIVLGLWVWGIVITEGVLLGITGGLGAGWGITVLLIDWINDSKHDKWRRNNRDGY